MKTRAALPFAIVFALLAGCGSGDGAQVGIDVSSLWQQAEQAELIELVYVRVYDDTGTLEISGSLLSMDNEIALGVTAGPSRRFEVEAVRTIDVDEIPLYWGESVIDLEAGTEIDLVVPVFPAGAVTGTLALSAAGELPAGAYVTATARAPEPDAPAIRRLPIAYDIFGGTLPEGRYDLFVDLDLDGTLWSRDDGGSTVEVLQGQIVTAGTVSIGPQ